MRSDVYEVEIEGIAGLSSGDEAFVDNHSLLNVLNLLHNEICMIGVMLGDDPEAMPRALDLCQGLVEGLRDASKTLICAERTAAYAQAIQEEIAAFRGRFPEAANQVEVGRSVSNIASLLRIWTVRAGEIVARARHPGRWESFSTETLARLTREVLTAIEMNSRGRYRIVYDRGQHGAGDYWVDLRFEPLQGATLCLPPVLVDVLRDLLANSRKYTAPGGEIRAVLREIPAGLELMVEDSGRGIPREELTRVVDFGVRGSNVADVRSMGGGFGLTKAFLVARRLGGRFWIASELGAGTRVRLFLPRPVGVPGVDRERCEAENRGSGLCGAGAFRNN